MVKRASSGLVVLALLLAGAGASAQEFDAASIGKQKEQIDSGLAKAYPHLDALYKDIHEHPELGFQETRTAAKLAGEMRSLGFEVTEHVGTTGIVAIYKNGPGPLVMVRTELDALPMEEKTNLPYASHATQSWNGKTTPVDHACGHDIHMAAWVGAAQALVSMKAQWSGTLMFVGQPAEETVGGARGMLADNLFKRFGKPDIGFAQHVTGAGAAGTISYRPGVNTSAADGFEVDFAGRGSHGSRPQLSIDPVLEASRFVVDVQSVVSREKDPAAFGVLTVGSITSGTAGNIIPDSAVVRGTIRSYDEEVRAKLKAGLVRTAKAVSDMAGAPPAEVKFDDGASAVVNDAAVTARTAPIFKAAFGDKVILAPTPNSASEDYSEFIIAGVPSLFWSIGGADPKAVADAAASGKALPSNHSPQFAPVPEPAIKTGVEAMTLAVLNAMRK